MYSKIIEKINLVHGTKFTELKQKQEEVLLKCSNKDAIAVLPTGYGKTLIMQMLPYINPDMEGCIIIVNPLNAILEEQKQRFGKSCVVVDSDVISFLEKDGEKPNKAGVMEDVAKLRNGDVKFIIGHPEHITDTTVKKIFMSRNLANKITHMVVDEAHCILSWGQSNFRPAFMKLGSMRAIIPNAKVLALTATATAEAQREICEALLMTESSVVSASPDRPNMFLEVKTRLPSTGSHITAEEAYENVIDPLLSELKSEGRAFPKTIMYLPLKWCGHIHHRAVSHFLVRHPDHKVEQACDDEPNADVVELTALIAQYHSPQSSAMKSLITKAMKDPNGRLRLLLATEAYGMGADAPDVKRVVHVGPPSTIETYMQEIGRGGRDGQPATATLFHNGSDIATNVTHLQEQMRRYCKIKTCRRRYLLEYFGFKCSEIYLHDCCDNCRKTCVCELCSEHQSTEPSTVSRKPNELIKASLMNYFLAENKAMQGSLLPELVTGLSTALANILSANPAKYSNFEDMELNFPNIKSSFRSNICKILIAFTKYKNTD